MRNEVEEIVMLNLARDQLIFSLASAGDYLATLEVLRRMEVRSAVLKLDAAKGDKPPPAHWR